MKKHIIYTAFLALAGILVASGDSYASTRIQKKGGKSATSKGQKVDVSEGAEIELNNDILKAMVKNYIASQTKTNPYYTAATIEEPLKKFIETGGTDQDSYEELAAIFPNYFDGGEPDPQYYGGGNKQVTEEMKIGYGDDYPSYSSHSEKNMKPSREEVDVLLSDPEFKSLPVEKKAQVHSQVLANTQANSVVHDKFNDDSRRQ